jgi:hypothetical protein
MSVVTRIVRRFTFPAEAPGTSLALYYALLFIVAALLFRYVPIIRPAFSGARLMEMASQGSNLLADQRPVVSSGALSFEFAFLLGVSMIGATLLMLPTAVVYMVTRRKKGFDQSVVQTMVVLALAVAGVVVIVRNSLALAFSLAGIVGAVRFRNTLPDTRDTLYIFVSIGVGLAAGVEALAAAAVLSVLFNYTVLMFHRVDFGMCEMGRSSAYLLHTASMSSGADVAPASWPAGEVPTPASLAALTPLAQGSGNGKGGQKEFNAVLVVRAKEPDGARPIVEQFLSRETKRWALAEIEKNLNGSEAVLKYLVRIGKNAEPAAIEDALLHIGAPNVIGARIH